MPLYGTLRVAFKCCFYHITGEECPEYTDVSSCVNGFMYHFNQSNPLLLIELGSISQYTEAMKERLYNLIFLHGQTIVSLSSGSGNFVPGSGLFGRVFTHKIRIHSVHIYFIPFTVEEFKTFKDLNADKYCLEDGEYKSLTNYNPLLLSLLEYEKTVEEAESLVNLYVRQAAADIEKSLKLGNFSWIHRTLPESMRMLYYAANNCKVKKSDYLTYRSTWVDAEGITYIKGMDPDTGDFVLSVNFPTYYEEMLAVLHENRKEKIHSAIINGFYFEKVVIEQIRELNILYSKKSEGLPSQPDLEAIDFRFKFHVTKRSNMAITGTSTRGCYLSSKTSSPSD